MLERKYKFQEVELKMQKFWDETEVYKFDYSDSRADEIFSIDTPPPTVSGSLHIGHIFSYTQAEMIARFQRMQGKNVFYPFGFDDNGLPTERLVEKEEGITGSKMFRSEFNKKCISTTIKYETAFKELWKSLGFSVDWSLQYETISPAVQKISQKSFIELAEKGKAYLKESPTLWCTCCQTSIAQAELDSTESETTFNWLTFQIDGENVTVATTRPELLYGCVALFVNPEDKRFKKYIGKEAIVPLYDFAIPVLGDEKVSIEKGSGLVMCATFGDTTDLEWYQTHELQYKKVINQDGRISDDVPFICGLKVKEAREVILIMLEENGLLIKQERLEHIVSVHERCGTEVEIISSKQWFIDVMKDKERFLDAANNINWYPQYMKGRYETWVENLKWDWCISRQRNFGIPLPVWYCQDCGETVFAKEEDLPINPLETSPREQCMCGSISFIPEYAVLDTWATSSLTPLINSKWGEGNCISDKILPMSLRTQAHEIIRTWAFYTIVKSIYHTGQIPWKDIMICGFVLAKKGEKISKSKDNSTLSPNALIEKYSADAIRYWAANAKLGTDTMFAEDEFQTARRFITKLWNAAKFVLIHLEDYDEPESNYKRQEIECSDLMPIDKWILEKHNEMQEKVIKYMNQYEVGSARHEIDEYFWKDFCDNYLEIVKDRVYKPEVHGHESRLSAQYALYHCFLGILKIYAVYVPHITEEIYQAFFKRFEKIESIHKTIWNKVRAVHENNEINEANGGNENILKYGEATKEILAEVRKYKSEKNISLKTELESIVITTTNENISFLKMTEKDLHACTGAKSIEFVEGEEFSVAIM